MNERNKDTKAAKETVDTSDVSGSPIAPDTAAILINDLKAYLAENPIDLQGNADNLIDFLFEHYVETVPISTEKTRGSYDKVALAFLGLIKARDVALGVETRIVESPLKYQESEGGSEWDGEPYPYNDELEKYLRLVNTLMSIYGDEAFRTGIEAGARLVFEFMGIGSIGVKSTIPTHPVRPAF